MSDWILFSGDKRSKGRMQLETHEGKVLRRRKDQDCYGRVKRD